MISKRVKERKDGKSSASDALKYGEGLKVDKQTGELLDKSHRTRLGNFGLVDNGVFADLGAAEMSEMMMLAALEMQSNCDLNTQVGIDKKLAHFVTSYNQDRPSEAVLRDTEESMLAAMELDKNHFATFLHNDNGHWHLHLFASRIEKNDPHRGNSLWQDKKKRDKVCREVEIRHGLQRDNGMHEIDEADRIIEIPYAERQARRESTPVEISDKAKTAAIYSGEKSFQAWANEIRIGDRLKHAKSWKDLHATAAAYNCEIKLKGAGFVICPVGEKGAIQLSKVGLKNLPGKFGTFQLVQTGHQGRLEAAYVPAPTQAKAASHYAKWRTACDAFKPFKTLKINEQRENHNHIRRQASVQKKTDLAKIRAGTSGQEKIAAVSIAKMRHAVALEALISQFAHERHELRGQLAAQGPGNTFRDYLVIEAGKGDNAALGLARKYGVEESTEILCMREAGQLKIVAMVSGQEYRPAPRLAFTHTVARNGTVIYDFGGGRTVTDSAISKQVQLNDTAARSPEAIATALRFATAKFGNTLTVTGSLEFQRLVVETAVRNGMNIFFHDPALQAYKQEFTASINKRIQFSAPYPVPNLSHLTHAQLAKGVQDVLNKTLDHGRPPDHIIHSEERRQSIVSDRACGMHELSDGSLDGEGQRDSMPLPNTLPSSVGNIQARQDQSLRRTGTTKGGSRGDRDAVTANIIPRTPGDGIVQIGTGELADEASERSRLRVSAVDSSSQSAKRVPNVAIPEAHAADPHQIASAKPTPTPTPTPEQIYARAGLTAEADNLLTEDAAHSITETKDETMATEQDHELVEQATAKRQANPEYRPTLVELKSIDQVLVEQAKKRLQDIATPQTAAEWIASQSMSAVQPYSVGNTAIEYTVIYVALDGVVINQGRNVAAYPMPANLALHVGDKVVVDRDAKLSWRQVPEQDSGKNEPGR